MSMLRNITNGLRSLFRKEQADHELNKELGTYLEMAAEEKMKQGMNRKDALRTVRLERGSLEVSKEIVRSGGWEFFLETCWRDLRFAGRTLRRSPGFAAVVVFTLALGIGANTAIFTLIDAVMLKSLPVADPKQLYRLGDSNDCCFRIGIPSAGSFVLYSYPLYQQLRDHTPEFSELAALQPALSPRSFAVRRSGAAEPAGPLNYEYVSGNYFATLRSDPAELWIPVRIALGADWTNIGRLVFSDGGKLTIAGLAIGLTLALTLNRFLSSYLFGISASDPATLIACCVLLVMVSGSAIWIPAWRATRVDPMVALRYD